MRSSNDHGQGARHRNDPARGCALPALATNRMNRSILRWSLGGNDQIRIEVPV